jgi:uncharacterized damage-inducible protein DinB
MTADQGYREQLARMLDWEEAHLSLDAAIEGLPPAQRGIQPAGLPYSCWQLLEHIRIAQSDILEFSRNPNYRKRQWPDEYWPKSPTPPDQDAWDACAAAVRRDREALKALAKDPAVDLLAPLPHGTGQTCLRALLLAVDHTSYHVGQLIAVRRLLGKWKAA